MKIVYENFTVDNFIVHPYSRVGRCRETTCCWRGWE